MQIKFGTSGWRGIMSRDFTFANLERVTKAIAGYLHQSGEAKQGLVVGYDTRFMSDHYAQAVARTLSVCGIPVFLTKRDTPTPAIAYHLIKKRSGGAINISASHNPPEYNGVKFSSNHGSPAPVEITREIEKEIANPTCPLSKRPAAITVFNAQPEYLKRLEQLVDLSVIKKAKPRIAVDCLYGTSRGYLDYILEKNGAKVSILHNYLDPLFGGGTPNPNKENLVGLSKTVVKTKSLLGVSADGDADRFGIVDRDGSYICANDILAIIFEYLINVRKLSGGIVRSITTTHLLDAIAAEYNRKVYEVPVGFKFVGSALLEEGAVMGGEESSGMSIQNHIPEKDGILACLLVAEIVTHRKQSLKSILKEIHRKYGAYYSTRIDIRVNAKKKTRLLEQIRENPLKSIAGIKLETYQQLPNNNFRYIFTDGSWIMIRPSGTEPILRCYMESRQQSKLKQMADTLRRKIK